MKSALCPLLIFAALMCLAPAAWAQRTVRGSGNVAQQTRQVADFHGISVGSAFRVYLQPGDRQSLRLEADDNVMPYIETRVSNGILTIEFSSEHNIWDVKRMVVYITYTHLDKLDLSGATVVDIQGTLKARAFELEMSGAAKTSFRLETSRLTLNTSGAAKVTLMGSAQTVVADVSGASKLDLSQVQCESAEADLSGASDLILNVTQRLAGDVSGASKLSYIGRPRSLDIETSGVARVRPLN